MAKRGKTKSEFVAQLSRELTAMEVVAEAERQGVAVTPAFVIRVRAALDRARIQARAGRNAVARGGDAGGDTALLRELGAIVFPMGMERAREVLAAQKRGK